LGGRKKGEKKEKEKRKGKKKRKNQDMKFHSEKLHILNASGSVSEEVTLPFCTAEYAQ
jgi:predicted ribonuclease toxin of YeeF-YezG toxin-antitoxin module